MQDIVVFVGIYAFIFGDTFRSAMIESMVGACLTSKKLSRCFPMCIYHFILLLAVNESFNCFTFTPILDAIFFNCRHSGGRTVLSH